MKKQSIVTYAYEENSDVYHDPNCMKLRKIKRNTIHQSTIKPENYKPCESCKYLMKLRGLVKDVQTAHNIEFIEGFLTKIGISYEELDEFSQGKNAFIKGISQNVVQMHYNEDNWQLVNFKGDKVTLQHNNYESDKNGKRKFTEGFHNQLTFDVSGKDALKVIMSYSYNGHNYNELIKEIATKEKTNSEAKYEEPAVSSNTLAKKDKKTADKSAVETISKNNKSESSLAVSAQGTKGIKKAAKEMTAEIEKSRIIKEITKEMERSKMTKETSTKEEKEKSTAKQTKHENVLNFICRNDKLYFVAEKIPGYINKSLTSKTEKREITTEDILWYLRKMLPVNMEKNTVIENDTFYLDKAGVLWLLDALKCQDWNLISKLMDEFDQEKKNKTDKSAEQIQQLKRDIKKKESAYSDLLKKNASITDQLNKKTKEADDLNKKIEKLKKYVAEV